MSTSVRKPTIFLHIGTEKTGTTTIQNAFKRNLGIFRREGLFFPSVPAAGKIRAHFGLVTYAAGKGDALPKFPSADIPADEDGELRNSFVARLAEEIAGCGCDRVLISSEHLSSSLRTQESVDRAVTAMRAVGGDVRVLVYLRPQHELFQSAYSTQVKGGRSAPCRAPRAAEHYFDYDKMLSLWENAAGQDNITVRLFSRKEFKDGDFMVDFFNVLGMAVPPGLDLNRNPNAILGFEALEFLRISNALEALQEPPKSASQVALERRALITGLERVCDKGGYLVPPEMLGIIEDLYRESNENVAARYFPGRAGGLFPAYVPSADDGPGTLTAERAVRIAVQLWHDQNDKIVDQRMKLKKRAKRLRAAVAARDEAHESASLEA